MKKFTRFMCLFFCFIAGVAFLHGDIDKAIYFMVGAIFFQQEVKLM